MSATRWPADQQPYVRTSECPSWCAAHVPSDFFDDARTTHYVTLTLGAVSVTVEQTGDGSQTGPHDPVGPAIILDSLEWVSGADAHDYAAVLHQAAQLVHPLGGEQR